LNGKNVVHGIGLEFFVVEDVGEQRADLESFGVVSEAELLRQLSHALLDFNPDFKLEGGVSSSFFLCAQVPRVLEWSEFLLLDVSCNECN